MALLLFLILFSSGVNCDRSWVVFCEEIGRSSLLADVTETIFCFFADCTKSDGFSEEEIEETALSSQIVGPYGLVTYSVEVFQIVFLYLVGLVVYVFSDAESFQDVIDYIHTPKNPDLYSTITSMVLYEKPISLDPNPVHWLSKIWRMVAVGDADVHYKSWFATFWFCGIGLLSVALLRFLYLRKLSEDKEVIELLSPRKLRRNWVWNEDETQLSLKLEVGSRSSDDVEDVVERASDEESMASSAIACSVVSDISSRPCTGRTDAIVQDLTDEEIKTSTQ